MLLPALALSVLGLLLGAALVTLGRRQALASAALDGFSLGFVPAVLALRMLPHAMGSLGLRAVGLAAISYGALWWVDRRAHDRDHAAAHPFHPAAGAGAGLLLPVLAVHGMSDGAALSVALSSRGAGPSVAAGVSLAAALILHRMPEGLFIASSILPGSGRRKTAAALVALAFSTVLGAALGRVLLDAIPDALFDGALALGVGAMLRLAMHSHAPRPPTARARSLAGVAFLGGVALVLALPDPAGLFRRALPRELSVQDALVPLLVETAPAMLLGVIAAGLLRTFAPARPDAWLRADGALAQALRGVAFGLQRQDGSAGVLRSSRALLRASLPVAAVTAFMLGAHGFDVGAFALSARLLGGDLALGRLIGGAALALGVGLAAAAVARRLPLRVVRPLRRKALLAAPPVAASAPVRLDRSPAGLLRAGLDHFDQSSAWYVVGLVLAVSFEAVVAPATLARSLGAWDVPLTALIAAPFYLGAQGTASLAAMMVHKGLSPGAALVLMLLGPATHVAAWRLLREALEARVAWACAGTAILGAMALGALANRVIPTGSLPEIHALAAHDHAAWELGAATMLALLLAGSVLRLGPRGWIDTLRPSDASSEEHRH